MTDKNPTELFDTFVGNVAGHASHLATDSGEIKMGALPGVWVEYFVKQKSDAPDVWDHCYVVEDGIRRSLGNRHGMTSHYSRLCAEALRIWLKDKKVEA